MCALWDRHRDTKRADFSPGAFGWWAGMMVLLFAGMGWAQPAGSGGSMVKQIAVRADTVRPMGVADAWLAPDKGKHFLGSLMLTVFTARALHQEFGVSDRRSRRIGVGVSLSLGLIKEMRDRRQPGNHFCWKDLLANLGGIGVAIVLLNQ